MLEGKVNERGDGGMELAGTTTALLQLLSEQQQQAREQQIQVQEQQAAQQALLLCVVEQRNEEMARYLEEMSHLLRKEESPAKSKLPKPNLQKLGPNEDIAHFPSTFERIAKRQEWPDTVWLAGLVTGKALAAMMGEEVQDYSKVKETALHQYTM